MIKVAEQIHTQYNKRRTSEVGAEEDTNINNIYIQRERRACLSLLSRENIMNGL